MAESKSILFHPDRPCLTPKEHVGREDIISYGYARLATDDIQSFAIIGCQHEGKTSLLNCIRHSETQSKYFEIKSKLYHFIYMDVSGNCLNSPQEFFSFFYTCIQKQLNIERLSNLWNDLPKISEFLEKNSQKLVVVIDDFNFVITNPNFPVAFYEGLRSWFSTHKNVGCIVTSPIQLLNLTMSLELAGSPFFNIFDSYSIPPLDEIEAKLLFESRLSENVFHENTDKINKIIEQFGLNPYPLQISGYNLMSWYSSNQTFTTKELIEKTAIDCNAYYQNIFSSLRDKQIEQIKLLLRANKAKDFKLDNVLFDRGLLKEVSSDVIFTSKQLELFFRDKLNIPVKRSFFSKIFKRKK